jgi:hypothetical protein
MRECEQWRPDAQGAAEIDETIQSKSMDPRVMLNQFRESREKAYKFSELLESKMSEMKFAKATRNKTDAWVYSKDDPLFGDYIPDMGKTIEAKNDLSIHPEMKKMLFSDLPEASDDRFDIHDERSAQNYEHYKELAYNYYRTKLQFFEDSFDNQMGYTTK